MSHNVKKTEVSHDNSGYHRLEEQIKWYDQRSLTAQRYFKLLKSAQIFVAALIPVASLIRTDDAIIPGVLGAVILILEGFQELGAYRQNWQKYRSACEALRHEKYLFMSSAGPYVAVEEDKTIVQLAERVEELVSQEHTNWITQFHKPKKTLG